VAGVGRALLHIDLDAFYASVEQRDQPALKGQPLIVGGHPKRGVVLAASYEVRHWGVHSAMPMSRALQLAPQAVVVAPRFSAYAQASEQVFRIFEAFTPQVEPLSLDEAFLDVTASVGLLGPPAQLAREIRRRISAEVGLNASAGIAAVKFVAKIASDVAKPNGQREVPPEETLSFLTPLPVSRLWGVGPKTGEQLRELGLRTVGDVASADPLWLERHLGSLGRHLYALSRGHDDREVVPDRRAKSVGAEDTLDEDIAAPERLLPHLHRQAERVACRLRRAGLKARSVQLKLKTASFALHTRQCTLPEATDDGHALYVAVQTLLKKSGLPEPLRLTGVSAQGLTSGSRQRGLFDEAPSTRDRLNAALDGIAAKFGADAVVTADIARGSEPGETAE
jgi:DNA polymerase IV